MENPRDAKARAKAEKAYRKAQRPWYKKKRFILILLFLLFIFFLILVVAVSGGGDESANNDSGGSDQQDAASQEEEAGSQEGDGGGAPEEEAEAEDPAFAGAQESDVIGEGGEEITLGDVAIISEPLEPGDDTFGPTLCTAVSISNNADEAIDFNALDWSLQEPGGTISSSGLGGSDDVVSAGQIAPGGSTSGDVCFDVNDPDASGQFVVLYEPLFSFFSDRGAWINER